MKIGIFRGRDDRRAPGALRGEGGYCVPGRRQARPSGDGGSLCRLGLGDEGPPRRRRDERRARHSAFVAQEVEGGAGVGLRRARPVRRARSPPRSRPAARSPPGLTVSCTSTAMPLCRMARSSRGCSRSQRSPVPTTTISGEKGLGVGARRGCWQSEPRARPRARPLRTPMRGSSIQKRQKLSSVMSR